MDWLRIRRRLEREPAYIAAMRLHMRVGAAMARRGRPWIVFESNLGQGMVDSPRVIWEAMRRDERFDSARMVWVRDPGVRDAWPEVAAADVVSRRSSRYFATLGRARMWVTNQNLDYYAEPQPHTMWVQTWHGTPLKRLGRDAAVISGREPEHLDRLLVNASRWDLLLAGGAWSAERFRSAFAYDGPILDSGLPRNDILFDADARDERRRELGVEGTHQVVLYAPTYRDDRKAGGSFEFSSGDDDLSLQALADGLPDGWDLWVRAHPIAQATSELQRLSGRARLVPPGADMSDLLAACTVLVTDYSSTMFDAAAAGRPVILFTPDLDHYADEARGLYFDLTQDRPGPLVRRADELAETIAAIAAGSDPDGDRRAPFAERYQPADDGAATARVLDAIAELLGPL